MIERRGEEQTFQDEQPSPGLETANTIHMSHTVRDSTAKGARERRACQNESRAYSAFSRSIPIPGLSQPIVLSAALAEGLTYQNVR